MKVSTLLSPAIGLLVVAVLSSLALADRLTLKDGSILEGKVIRKADGYWIKLDDGTTRTVEVADVAKYEKAAATSASGTPDSPAPSKSASACLAAVKHQAEVAETPNAAVELWKQFIDTKPSADDLTTAKSELARWQTLADGHAEKIKGRWVSGKELQDLKDRMNKIRDEFNQLMKDNQAVTAIKKLEEAEKLDPESYEINWLLGYCSLVQHDHDKAITYFDKATRLCPKLSAAYGDWGLALIGKKKPLEALAKFQQVALLGDSPQLAQNLRNTLALIPESQRNSPKVRDALATDGLMSSRYPQAVTVKGFVYFPYRDPLHRSAGGSDEQKPPEWAGTGFLIDATGLILTNRHVASGARVLTVIMNNGEKKVASVVAIDNEQDLALIRIKVDGDLPFLSLSIHDQPAEGADCTVMGYPLYGKLGTNIKVTRGIVTGIEPGELGPDVLVDAKVNPGNSGGPMIDKHGNVMAIVSMKTISNATEDTYGIGLSAGHVRKFLIKNHIKITPNGDDGDSLDAEAIAARVKPAAVCILGEK